MRNFSLMDGDLFVSALPSMYVGFLCGMYLGIAEEQGMNMHAFKYQLEVLAPFASAMLVPFGEAWRKNRAIRMLEQRLQEGPDEKAKNLLRSMRNYNPWTTTLGRAETLTLVPFVAAYGCTRILYRAVHYFAH